MKPHRLILPLLLLVTCVTGWAQFAGPVSTTGLKNGATMTWTPGSGVALASDGQIAHGSGKTIYISNVSLAADTTVYWTPTTVGISLDDTDVSDGELMSYRNSSETSSYIPQSNPSGGFAVFYVQGFFRDTNYGGATQSVSLILRMTATDNSTGAAIPLVETSAISSGVGVPMTSGQTVRIQCVFQIYNGSSWEAAYDFYDAQHTYGNPGAAYTFEQGFFYDARPVSINLSSSSLNENLASGTSFATLSVNDPNPSALSTSYALVSGSGSTNNGSFSISGTGLVANQSFNYEATQSQSIRLRATNSYGYREQAITVAINDVNEAPTAINLGPASINENEAASTLVGTLSTTDPDTLNAAFRTATFAFVSQTGSSNDNYLFTLNGSQLLAGQSFDYEKQASRTLSIRATNGTLPALDQTVTVTIVDQNDPPVSGNLSLSVLEDQPLAFSLTGTFGPGFSDEDLTFPHTLTGVSFDSLTSNGTISGAATGTTYSSSQVAGFSYQGGSNFNGTDTFTYRASDGSALSTSAGTATITVVAVNDPPTFDQPATITFAEDTYTPTANRYALGLTGVTVGPSNEQSSQQIASISGSLVSGNTGLLKSISGDATGKWLYFNSVQDANGTATLQIAVQDNGGVTNGGVDTLTRTVTINVTPVDDPPYLAQPFSAINVTEDQTISAIDLSQYFKDVDSTLSFAILSNTKDTISGNSIENLVTASISGSTLNLALVPYSWGSATLTIQATGPDESNDGGSAKTVTGTLTVNVAFKDHPPQTTSSAPTAPLVYEEDSGPLAIDLSGWFDDPDEDSFTNLSFDATSVDQDYFDLGAITPTLSGTTDGSIQGSLLVGLVANAYTAYTAADGTSASNPTSITLTATSGGKSVTFDLPLTIQEVNDPPTLDTIGNQSIAEGTDVHRVALSGITPGPNESTIDAVTASGITATGGSGGVIDPSTIAISNYDASAGTALLTYQLKQFQYGSDSITVTVVDERGGTFSRTFTVKAAHVNQAPQVVSPLPAPFLSAPLSDTDLPILTYLEDQSGIVLSAANLFSDPDGDTLTQKFFANTNPSLLTTAANGSSGTSWALNLQTDQVGTADLVLRASDGYLTADYGFQVSVTPVNDPPTLDPIGNIRLSEGAAPKTITLSGITTGPANESDQSIVAITGEVTASSIDGLVTAVTGTVPDSTSPSTGSITFTLADDLSGTATIRVTVQDSGGTANGGVDTAWREFKVTVNPVDNAPVLSAPIGTVTYLEDQFSTSSYQTSVDLSGVFTDRDHDAISLRIIGITDTPNLLDNETPGRVLVPSSAPESIQLTFNENGNGTSTISYGAIAGGLVSNANDTLTVTVTPVNDPPTLSAPANQLVNQGAGPFTVRLRNLSSGPANESSQSVTITDVAILSQSSDGLISSLTFSQSDATSGVVNYAVADDATGTATIRVTLQDDGGTANNGDDTATYDFVVTVAGVDHPPVLSGTFPNQTFLEDQFASNREETKLDLTDVFTDPDGDTVSLVLTSDGISDPDNILDDEDRLVVVDSDEPQKIDVTFVRNAFGTATLTVGAVANDLSAAQTISFTITVTPVNDAPTLDALSNLTLAAGAGAQTVSLSGITVGDGDPSSQNITSVTASVVNASVDGLIVGTPSVTYSPNDATGSLSFTPGSGLTGTATIRVTVEDDGGTANGGVDTASQSFVVTVSPVDSPPVLANPIGTVTYSEDDFSGSGDNLESIDLSNVFTDPDGDAISIVVNAISDPDGIIDDNAVAVDSSNATQLNVPFIANANGTATIRYHALGGRALSTDADVLTLVVTPSNDLPTLSSIRDQSVSEDSGTQTVQLSGIGAGVGEDASNLTISAAITSENPSGLIQNLAVTYTAPATTGTLTYAVGNDLAGTAIITVTVDDGDGLTFSRSFDVYVLGTDDGPVVKTPTDTYTLLEDQGNGSPVGVDYTGVFDDLEGDTLSLFVHSIDDSADDVIADESGGVTVNGSDALTLDILLNPDANGTFSITTGASGEGRASSGYNVRTFTVTPVNDPPVYDPITNPTVDEDAAPFAVSITGIAPGPANESSQTVNTATASVGQESVDGLIASVSVDYTAGADAATVTVTPTASLSGTAQIIVSLQDDGGTANGGADTAEASFLVTVNPVSDPPQLVSGQGEQRYATSSDVLPENRQVTIDLSGVFTDDDGETVALVISTISDPDGILDEDAPGGVAFSASSPESLLVTFTPDSYGVATLQFQGLAGGQFSAASASLTITLTPPQGAPSFDPIAAVSVEEDSGADDLEITGVRPGLPPSGSASVTALTAAVTASDPAGLLTDVSLDYTAGADTGVLHFTPVSGLNGTATITVTVTDNGATASDRVNTFSQEVVVTVTPVEDPPYRDHPFAPPTFNEDAFLAAGGRTRLDLTGVFVDDDGEAVEVEIRSISDPDNVLDDEGGNVATDPLSPQKLLLAFKENAFGSIDFTVGAVANGASSSDVDEFTLVVNPVNDAPTIDAIGDLSITTRAMGYTVDLAGIGVGPSNESTQNISAVSASVVSASPSGLIENLAVTHDGNDATGMLSFGLGARFGTAKIQVTVKDDGGTTNGGVDTITRQFTVNVNIEDKPPVLTTAVADQSFLEDAFTATGGTTTLDLTGSYVDPDGDTVSYVLGPTDDPDDIFASGGSGIALSGTNNTTLTLKINPNAFGTATIRFRGTSRGLFAADYDEVQVTVSPVNDAPTLDAIADQTVPEGSGAQSLTLTGISVGPLEGATQNFSSVTAVVTSGDSSIFAVEPALTLDASGRAATLSYTPAENHSGTATISVTLTDNGGTANGGVDTVNRTFALTVTEVDHPPVSNGTVPSFTYDEDQFSSAGGLTTETLPTLFTDPDGETVSLLLGAISDPDDILDNEAGLVKLLSDSSLQLAIYDDAYGEATIPVYGFANGLKSDAPILITITVNPINDAPKVAAPNSIAVKSAQTKALLSMQVQSLGEREENQKLKALSATWSDGSPVEISGMTTQFSTGGSGVVNLEIDLSARDSARETLELRIEDDGGRENGGIDTTSRSLSIVRPELSRPEFEARTEISAPEWVERDGTSGILLSLGNPVESGSNARWVPFAVRDPGGVVEVNRSGLLEASGDTVFLAISREASLEGIELLYGLARQNTFAPQLAAMTLSPRRTQAEAVAFPDAGSLRTRLEITASTGAAAPVLWTAELVDLTSAQDVVPLARFAWQMAANDAGIGARRLAVIGSSWVPDASLNAFVAAVLEVPVLESGRHFEAVAHSYYSAVGTIPDDFATWRQLQGVEGDSAEADLDGDGYSLRLEYLLGLDPLVDDRAALQPEVKRDGDAASFIWELPRMRQRGGALVILEQLSSDGTWSAVSEDWEIVENNPVSDLVRWTLPIDADGRPVLLRLRSLNTW